MAQLKRRLIREAVQENRDVMTGRYRFRRPTKTKRAQTFARIVFFLTLPVALFGASYLGSEVADRWIDLRSTEIAERVAADVQLTSGLAGFEQDLPAPRGPESGTGSAEAPLATPAALDRAVFPLGVRRIVLDPGHGGKNPGTQGPNGLAEKTLALDIAKRLTVLLEDSSFEVAMTRKRDVFVPLEDRARYANETEGDLFVSIHLNYIEAREVRGIETYYLGPTEDPYLTELAAAENQDAGYSMADYRRVLDQVYAGVRNDESRQLARSVQRALYNSLRRVNPGLQNRGVKKAPFIVLTGTEMPAILAEVSCLSNANEARLLMTPGYRQYIAEALFRGISSYARQLNESA